MPYDPLKNRRIVLVDVLDISTGQHSGEAVEFLIPHDEAPKSWRGHPTADQVREWLASDLPAGKRTIATKARAGLDASQRLLAVVKDLKADAALAAWRTKRRMADATQATDADRARVKPAEGEALHRADEP